METHERRTRISQGVRESFSPRFNKSGSRSEVTEFKPSGMHGLDLLPNPDHFDRTRCFYRASGLARKELCVLRPSDLKRLIVRKLGAGLNCLDRLVDRLGSRS